MNRTLRHLLCACTMAIGMTLAVQAHDHEFVTEELMDQVLTAKPQLSRASLQARLGRAPTPRSEMQALAAFTITLVEKPGGATRDDVRALGAQGMDKLWTQDLQQALREVPAKRLGHPALPDTVTQDVLYGTLACKLAGEIVGRERGKRALCAAGMRLSCAAQSPYTTAIDHARCQAAASSPFLLQELQGRVRDTQRRSAPQTPGAQRYL